MALRFPISFSLAIKRSFYCSNSCFSSTLQQQSVVCSSICSLSSIQDIQIMWNWWWHLHSALKFEKKYNKRYECIEKKTAFTQIIKYKSYIDFKKSRYFTTLVVQRFCHIFTKFHYSKVITSFFFVWPGTILFQSFFCVFHSCFSIQRFKKTELHINVNLCRWNSRRLQSIKSEIAGNTVFFVCDYCVTAACIVLCISFQFTSYTMIQTSSCYSPMLGKILEFDKDLICLQIPLLFLVNNFAMNQKEKNHVVSMCM